MQLPPRSGAARQRLVRVSYGVQRVEFLGFGMPVETRATSKGAAVTPRSPLMTNLRSIIVTVTILASFLLVLAAPFRWF